MNTQIENLYSEWVHKLKNYMVNEYTNEQKSEWIDESTHSKVSVCKNKLSKKVKEWMSTL